MGKESVFYIFGLILMSFGAYFIGMEYAHSKPLALGIGLVGYGAMSGFWMIAIAKK